MAPKKEKSLKDTKEMRRLKQQIRRNMIQKVKPSKKTYKRFKKDEEI